MQVWHIYVLCIAAHSHSDGQDALIRQQLLEVRQGLVTAHQEVELIMREQNYDRFVRTPSP
jgi:hypothetical protein